MQLRAEPVGARPKCAAAQRMTQLSGCLSHNQMLTCHTSEGTFLECTQHGTCFPELAFAAYDSAAHVPLSCISQALVHCMAPQFLFPPPTCQIQNPQHCRCILCLPRQVRPQYRLYILPNATDDAYPASQFLHYVIPVYEVHKLSD